MDDSHIYRLGLNFSEKYWFYQNRMFESTVYLKYPS